MSVDVASATCERAQVNRFGEHLRRARTWSGVTLKSLADAVGVSVSYMSDIETGKRAPFSDEKIIAAARHVRGDVGALLCSAAADRGAVTIPAVGDTTIAMLVSLRQRIATLDADQVRKIHQMVA